jgi:hypothetical protein
MVRLTKEVKKEVTNIVSDGFICDRCGNKYDDYGWDGLAFEYRQCEEDEILIEAEDICENCFENEEFWAEIRNIAQQIRNLFPHASVRSNLMMEWEATGIYKEEDD